MALLLTAPVSLDTSTGPTGYTLLLADGADEVVAAQRLRYRAFAGDVGAAFGGDVGARPSSHTPGMDVDELDAYCDHLIVRDDATGEVVGTCRLLPPTAAARVGRRCAAADFDLSGVDLVCEHLVEVDRCCVAEGPHQDAVLDLIWTGVVRYLRLRGYRWLGGCVSVPLDVAAPVWERVRARHLAPPGMRVYPRRPWLAEPGVAERVRAARLAAGGPAAVDLPGRCDRGRTGMPPLLRGYLRLGGWVCGDPAYDPDRREAHLFVLLSTARINPRDRRQLRYQPR